MQSHGDGQLSKIAKLRQAGRLLLETPAWAALMGTVTIVAILGLSLHWYPENETLTTVATIIYYSSVFFFFLEFVLKILCYGTRQYFKDGNNILDFSLVLINILSIFNVWFDIDLFAGLPG